MWQHELFNQLQTEPIDDVLDVCCRTGDLIVVLAERTSTGRVTRLDFNKEMLEIAKGGTKMIGNLFLVQRSATALPSDNDSFDIVTIDFDLRDVPDADEVLSEIYRVLKPGGQSISSEMSQPTNPIIKVGRKAYFTAFPLMASLVDGHYHNYQYLKKTSQQFVSAHQLVRMMKAAGFKEVHY